MDTPLETQAREPAGDADDDAAIGAAAPVAPDERRMQVRAYNAWAGLLGEGAVPALADLAPAGHEFSPNAVLLDFSDGAADPAIRHLGERLAEECGTPVRTLAEVPDGSLLARITEHLARVLADHTPLGFEAESLDRHGATIVYRGILLPFSGDGRTIDFIYGVINWKALADRPPSDTLLREDGALATAGHRARRDDRLTVWADGPAGIGDDDHASAAWVDTTRLRGLATAPFAALPAAGDEFALLVARRLPTGEVVLVGEVPDDGDLLARATDVLLAHTPPVR
ncbi:MAG: hypothetical protein ABW194_12240 [Novosphingobium sp.]